MHGRGLRADQSSATTPGSIPCQTRHRHAQLPAWFDHYNRLQPHKAPDTVRRESSADRSTTEARPVFKGQQHSLLNRNGGNVTQRGRNELVQKNDTYLPQGKTLNQSSIPLCSIVLLVHRCSGFPRVQLALVPCVDSARNRWGSSHRIYLGSHPSNGSGRWRRRRC